MAGAHISLEEDVINAGAFPRPSAWRYIFPKKLAFDARNVYNVLQLVTLEVMYEHSHFHKNP